MSLPLILHDENGGLYYSDNTPYLIKKGTVDQFMQLNLQYENQNLLGDLAKNGYYGR
jgi:hypothetical protein